MASRASCLPCVRLFQSTLRHPPVLGSGRLQSTQISAVKRVPQLQQSHDDPQASKDSDTDAVSTGDMDYNAPALFRTNITDPTKHSLEHEGKLYSVPEAVKQQLFTVYKLNKKARQFHDLTGDFSIMIRSPFLEARDYIRAYDYTQPALRIVLYGKLGTGKSHTVAHLLHYAYTTDWLIVANHWLPEWVKRPKEIQANETNSEIRDSPVDAAVWLQHFIFINGATLARLNLTTSQTWKWSDENSVAKGEPLINIAHHGVERMKHACSCVRALLEEIKAHTDSGRAKTFVSIEGVNALWETSYEQRIDKSYIPASDFHLVRSFRDTVLKNDWRNAVVIVTVDEGALSLQHRKMKLEEVPSFMPTFLLGRKGFEFFEPCVPICTKNYTSKEFESIMSYYIETNFIQNPNAKTESARKEFEFLSGRNPRELMKLCQWI